MKLSQPLAAIALSVGALVATAGTGTGKIDTIWVANNATFIMFSVTEPLEDSPRCNETNRFAINLLAPGGEAVYRSLLAAKEQGWSVKAMGLNTCRQHFKAEDLRELVVQ